MFGTRTSSTCANYALLKNGIDNKEGHQLALKAIKRNFYLDVFTKSVTTVEEVIQVYKDIRTTLKLGGFNLLKWICYDDLVTGSIPEGDRSEAKNKTFEAEPYTSSLLGMQWNVDDDTLEVCRSANKEMPKKFTQRASFLGICV